jgi:hypothetical protein
MPRDARGGDRLSILDFEFLDLLLSLKIRIDQSVALVERGE